ncbi:hypothetical protein ACFOHK_16475 [Falsigemmobacter intermedius]|uniref:hypothetical protein n=1 Tax=Falsigemmobacter intermedius TaxID=1553448 RepID=UPI003613F835
METDNGDHRHLQEDRLLIAASPPGQFCAENHNDTSRRKHHPTSGLAVNQPFVLNMFSQKPKYAASGQPGHIGSLRDREAMGLASLPDQPGVAEIVIEHVCPNEKAPPERSKRGSGRRNCLQIQQN